MKLHNENQRPRLHKLNNNVLDLLRPQNPEKKIVFFVFQYLFFPLFFINIFHYFPSFFDFFDLIFLKYQWKILPTLFGKKLTFCIIRPRVSEVKKVVEVHCWSGLSWQMVSNKVEVDSSGLSRDSCESAYSICNKYQKWDFFGYFQTQWQLEVREHEEEVIFGHGL